MRFASWLLAALVFTPAAPALAQDGGRLGLGLKAVVKGKDRPAITVSPREDVKKLAVTLERSDGKVVKLSSGALAPGKTKVLSFDQPQGVFGYTARFRVEWKEGDPTEFSTTFEATKVGELKLEIGPGDVDMGERHMSFTLTNPAKKAELVLLGERGRRLDVVEKEFDGEAPGTRLELTWGPVPEELLRMDLKVTDIAGFYAGVQITPFTIEIPHDDVVFETGSHEIRESEAPKLEKTLGHVKEALKKHGTLLELKLYVGGYTDTVGSRASNQGLSERRARSIAAWFKAKGLTAPVFYQGFGEDVLAVATPDETPEAKNRRALYILSSQDPTGSQVPRNGWHKM